jgi:bifunctional UDP-N-acetylglucosamine pyrophosphorylase/glucosamine-1-phosphate N-acetyltransferase
MVMGINSRRQMADAEKVMRERILNDLMDSGVTIMDPASTFIEKTVKIAPDTIIYPYTWLQGTTTIGTDCEIGPNVRFTNVKVGEGNQIQFCYAHDCEVKSQTTIGPYVHLRPDTVIDDKVHIGNYVEVKNSTVGKGTKLPHLTYIGDTDIGSGVNMGCGCITVNYDGKVKHRTKIGDNAFVGCNTNLVAPVEVGKNTYIGAGSTITKNVPENALGIGRARQLNIEGWAKNKLKK